MKITSILWKIILVSLFILYNNAFGYDDKITHPDITEKAISNSRIGTYLKSNLGLNDGIDTKIPASSKYDVRRLIMEGSKLEDSPNCRAASHFLNPLADWSVAGVSDTTNTITSALGINPFCFVTAPFSSKFSIHKYADITWATGYTAPDQKGGDTGNDMDWNAARAYYRLALTAADNAAREASFAKTFQALGQVMHLLQDMAVPAHVRNDFTAHLAFQKVNDWNPSKWYGNTYEWYVKNHEGLINSAAGGSTAVLPPDNLLTALWDAEKYKHDGSNPSNGTDQGLAEYTNANFFSESTIFAELKDPADIHYFPRPAKVDTDAAEKEAQAVAMEVTAEDGELDTPLYVVKKDGNYKIAAYSFLTKWVESKIIDDGYTPYKIDIVVKGWKYNLDDKVYEDYAKKLIPRAVGYSAGLINYFFRGQIDMTADAGQYVIKNESDEAMSGIFSLYYDDINGMRKLVPAAQWNLSIAAKGASSPVTFTPSSDAKEAGKYMLVFLGKHGVESGAVVGKSIELKKDLDIRIVTVSNYVSKWEDRRGQIKVFTNKGVIYGQIPREMFSSVIKVHFDKSNKNHIAILVAYGDTYKILKFNVDEENQTINYEKTIFEQLNFVSSEGRELLSEDVEIFNDPVGGRYKYITWNVKVVYSNKLITIIDFYIDNEEVKQFYGINILVNEFFGQDQFWCWENENCSSNNEHDFDYTSRSTFRSETTEIFYGNNKIASVNNLCTGGYIENNGYSHEECTNEKNVNTYYLPLAIFNKNDYAYGISHNYNSLVGVETTIPFDFSKYIVNGKISLNNLVLEDNSYGFNLIKSGEGTSVSSSLGTFACAGILVTDRQVGDGYVAKNWRGEFMVFRGCDDYTIINAPAYSINDKEVSDFYVK